MFRPAILALIGVSAVTAVLLVAAGHFALRVLRHWDIQSGSERQLQLERRTYLIATFVAFAFSAQLVALLLFIYNAEAMSGQFVGAMCATGVLNVNGYGWPTLFLKIALFFLGALWLALNALDNKGHDYPLTRIKYGLLILIVPIGLTEFGSQLAYFSGMDPNIITSCCGSLFSPNSEGVAAEVSSLPPLPALAALYGSGAALLMGGVHFLRSGRGGWFFAGLNVAAFLAALTAIVSSVAIYIYEHPNHHCPFCILKSGYDYIGYLLYVPLFTATASGIASGALAAFKRFDSISDAAVLDARRLARRALMLFALFYAVATYSVVMSHLTLLPP